MSSKIIIDSNLHQLTISNYLKLIKQKKIEPIDLINQLISRVKKYEKYLNSMSIFSIDDILNQVDFIKKNKAHTFSLNGAAVGIKDVYNTINHKTSFGSQIYKNFRAGNNARIVDDLINNNAILFCKTKTAEFSVHNPPNTINPYSINHIAGTSSTGSAVAVSAGFVQSALGTQTAGSTFRPASYNGIYGYKPSFGLFPRTGLLKTTDTLDHPTLLTRSINDIEILFDIIRVKGENYPLVQRNLTKKKYTKKNKLFFYKGNTWKNLDKFTQQQFMLFINKVESTLNLKIKSLKLNNEFNKIHQSHDIIYNKSLSYYFKNEFKNYSNLISTSMIDMITKGNNINLNDYNKELRRQENLQNTFNKLLENSIIISPCTSGEAPKKNEFEKNDLSLFWTYLNIPCLSIPCLKGKNNLPVSIIVASSKFEDYLLFDFVKYLKKNKLIKDSKTTVPNVN